MAGAGKKKIMGVIDSMLLFIIILNILDFFEILPSELDYIKKIMSWTLLGYFLFRVSPSRVFFGKRREDIDLFIIIASFLLIIKNLISYAGVSMTTTTKWMLPFFSYLLEHYAVIEQTSFLIGSFLLLALALYVAAKIPFTENSIMGALHATGEPKLTAASVSTRFLFTLLVFFSYFLFIFNLMMEWLAIAIDATLLLIALFFYLLFVVRHHLSVHELLSKIVGIGSAFFRRFLEHLRSRKGLLLGVAGLLVLHLLTDVGNFLIPYITGVHDPLYWGFLGAGHESIWSLLGREMGSDVWSSAVSIVLFCANLIVFIMLFLSPAVIWYRIAHRRKPSVNKGFLVIFFTCLPAAILSPLFHLQSLQKENLIGVDITTSPLSSGYASPSMTLIVMSVVLVIAVIMTEYETLSKGLNNFWVLCGSVFFGMYSWLFFVDVLSYYHSVVSSTTHSGNYYIAGIFFLFESLAILFYLGGFISFVIETVVTYKKQVKASASIGANH